MDEIAASFDMGDLDEMLQNVKEPEPETMEWEQDLPDEIIWKFIAEIEAGVNASTAGENVPVAKIEPPVPEPVKKPPVPFVKLSEAQLQKIEDGKDEKTTKSATSWGVNRIKSKKTLYVHLLKKITFKIPSLFCVRAQAQKKRNYFSCACLILM